MADVIQSMLNSDPRFLTAHHIESYDHFVKDITSIVRSFKQTKKKDKAYASIEAFVGGRDFDAVTLEWNKGQAPNISDLRLKNYSYTRNVHADVLFVATDQATGRVEEYTVKNQRIGILPVMVGSDLCVTRGLSLAERRAVGECPFDLGGYFIIDGKEKVIVSQERGVLNRLFVEDVLASSDAPEKELYSTVSFARCVSVSRRMAPRTTYIRTLASGPRKDAIVVDVPGLKGIDRIPLFTIFRALGVESDAAIVDLIAPADDKWSRPMRDFLRPSIVDGNFLYTRAEALAFLESHVKFGTEQSLLVTLLDEFLPQVSTSFADKAVILAQYCRRVVKVRLGVSKPTDRDNFLHKRVSTSGYLLNELFLKYYEQFQINLGVAIDNEFNIAVKNNYEFPFLESFVKNANPVKIFQTRHIDDGMNKSFKGAWGVLENMPSSVSKELGIVQDLSRVSYMSFLSHLRRVAAPLDDKAKVTGPHKLNGTQWGIMCPVESPDGRNVGLLKNISLLARITRGGMRSDVLIEALRAGIVERPPPPPSETRSPSQIGRGGPSLYANNVFLFDCADSIEDVVAKLLKFRDAGVFGPDAGVSFDRVDDEVHVRTDDGRICRPLWSLSVGGGEQKVEENKKIVYLDVEEINSLTRIAMDSHEVSSKTSHYTHCEIHPCGILSAYSCTIPFANHNQCVRNVFSSAQGKQAIGIYATNFRDRIDTAAYTLSYPQRPLVDTFVSRMLPAGGLLNNGENVIVAIACYSGYNMEDSVILNRASVERGMFNVTVFKTLYGEEESTEAERSLTRIVIGVGADDGDGGDGGDIDERGLPKLNAYIGVGKTAISRLRYVDTFSERKTQDFLKSDDADGVEDENEEVHEMTELPVKGDRNHEGFVDRVFAISKDRPRPFCKVRLRQHRTPELGDKMASRHGQKGVVGAIMPPEDMPFCAGSGIVPDVIINPHALPSRMTVGHLLECIAAKATVAVGSPSYDATPFQEYETYPEFRMSAAEQLAARGFERHGNELMHDGPTGQQMAAEIFVGPTYYYRLKHMVADKINSRASLGPIVGLTGQPTKGRANDGGMRVGEMERDAILAHGMASFMKETFGERSDGKTALPVQHGDFTYENVPGGLIGGDEKGRVGRINCPEAFKLLTQELKAFHVDVRIRGSVP